MDRFLQTKDKFKKCGYTVIEKIYSEDEIGKILRVIEETETAHDYFRKSKDLFAIRQFLKVVPESFGLIFNEQLKSIISHVLGEDFFVVKSYYFDKPESSNWFVAYHQDLTISVDKKVDIPGFGPWTIKQNQFAVQPPVRYLENIITIRIHLDETNVNNGALKVIPGSHVKKIYRPETINWEKEKEETCCVGKGGIMLMKPLLLHRSSRTQNQERRRVIHIEFSNQELPQDLRWSERLAIQTK